MPNGLMANAPTREDAEVIDMLKAEFPGLWDAACKIAQDNHVIALSILKRCCMRVLEIRLGLEDRKRQGRDPETQYT